MSDIQAALTDAIGPNNISTDLPGRIDEILTTDARPACIAFPTTSAELGQVLALAHENGWRTLPIGQASKLTWGGLTKRIDFIVSTARLNQIVDHAIGDFTVTVQSGLKVGELRSRLAEQGQFLAVDPAFAQAATVGGLVATADAGSLRQRYGGLRDMLIGVQFARYDGKLARAGGKVVKNVAGYDLMKLMTGSYGSLGVLSELTFRLYPQMSNLRSLLLTGTLPAIQAATAHIRLSGLTPIAFDVLSKQVMTSLGQSEHHGVVARFQGVLAGVEEQSDRLIKIAKTHEMSVQQLDGEADASFWQASAELIQSDTLLCKLGLKSSEISSLLALVDDVAPKAQVRMYASSGLGWAQNLPEEAVGKVRSHCENHSGFLTLLQAPKPFKEKTDIWGYSGNALSVMSSIKHKFDPNGLLSPDRFVGNL